MNKLNSAFFIQGAKFLLVGALNTLIDFAVLNALIFVTGIASGAEYSIFKALSFSVAVLNSYFLNKFWTFGSKEKTSAKEFTQFLAVSIVGFFINVGTATFMVNMVHPQLGISSHLWANVGALTGTIITMAWNFFGYKFFVFKK